MSKHRRPTDRRRRGPAVAALAVALITTLGASSPALAAKGGGGKPPSGSGSSSLSLVLLDATDGLPHYGQRVTFRVSTTATTRPFVRLNCYQNGVWLYAASAGYFADYPWSQDFILSSGGGAEGGWSSGAADCDATLYSNDGKRSTDLAKIAFHVEP
jgi:hypothetical protein